MIIKNIIENIYFSGYCPTKIIVRTIKNIIKAVEKFEGKINIKTTIIGIHRGIKEDLKSILFSRFFDR